VTAAAASVPAGPPTARDELLDVVRAPSGGLLFGVPLLYTMEVWWTGSRTTPIQMAVLLGLLILPVFVLNLTAGFRAQRDVRVRDAAADTAESVVIGIVVTAVVLILIRQITTDTPIGAALGMVLYESIPFCLGVGVARHFLRGGRDANDDDEGSGGSNRGGGTGGGDARGRPGGGRTDALDGTLADLGATVIGAAWTTTTARRRRGANLPPRRTSRQGLGRAARLPTWGPR
jgi:putative integral membrane protein (TIGR02587 family)